MYCMSNKLDSFHCFVLYSAFLLSIQFPSLCEQFYTFVKFACDMHAEQLVNSTLDLYQAVFHLVKTGTIE